MTVKTCEEDQQHQVVYDMVQKAQLATFATILWEGKAVAMMMIKTVCSMIPVFAVMEEVFFLPSVQGQGTNAPSSRSYWGRTTGQSAAIMKKQQLY